MSLLKRINWHVLAVGLGGLFVAGSPLAAFLTSFGISNATQDSVFHIFGSGILLAGTVAVILKAAISVTDPGKARLLESLDPASWDRILSNMHDEKISTIKAAIDKRTGDA